jgi:hypothetical protein
MKCNELLVTYAQRAPRKRDSIEGRGISSTTETGGEAFDTGRFERDNAADAQNATVMIRKKNEP